MRHCLFIVCLLFVSSNGIAAPAIPVFDVYVSGTEGYASFRIPSLIVTQNKTVLAFAEGRVKPSDHAENDIVLKRSIDGGRTWSKLQVVAEDGANSLNNPQAVVVRSNFRGRETGRVLLMYQRYPKGIHEHKVAPGYDDPAVCRNFITHSDDDGKTWSKPREITRMVKRPTRVTSIAGGPGIGIQLRHGEHKNRIIMPFNEGPFGDWRVYAVYSDDGGETWKYGEAAPHPEKGRGNEVQMVELADGSVMLNSRGYKSNGFRFVAVSKDGGQTWSQLREDKRLVEPQCMASIIRYSDPADGEKSRIIFSSPGTRAKGRVQGALYVSYDEGKTWKYAKIFYPGSFAYSCIARMPSGAIGCLFERDGYKKISFTPLTLEWLTDGKDKPEQKKAASAAKPSVAAFVGNRKPRRDYSIPVVDLNNQSAFHVIVAKDIDSPNQYLGHPSTVLLNDRKSILAAFPTGHGRGRLRLRRSADGGRTWSSVADPGVQLAELPTLFSTQRPDGKTRIVLVTCVPKTGELKWMDSDDQGVTWSVLKTKKLGGTRGIIVALSSTWRVRDDEGKPTFTWRGVFHDYNFDNFTIDLTFEREADTPEKWSTRFGNMRRINFASPTGLSRGRQAQLCEAGVVRSPDGKQLALLFRPQRKQTNAMISLSSDEGLTWSDPKELPGSLTGERHVARYAPDGRLFVTFRDYSPINPGNPTHADWVAWVGRWEDLIHGREGQYRVRMKDNYGNSTNRNVGDCGYAAVELLPDGTFVCTSYGHWELARGQKHPNGRGRSPYIIATRFKLKQLDAMVKQGVNLLRATGTEPQSSPPLDVFVLTGQSNSLGTTADTKERDTSPGSNVADANVKFFWSNRSTRAGDNTANIIGDSGGEIVSLCVQQGEGRNKTFWGPEFGFARELNRQGKRNILIIKASRGGGGNSFWEKSSKDNHMYRHVVDTVHAAIAQLPRDRRFEIRALLYLQGESNNASEAAVAGQRVAQLAVNLKRDLPNARDMKVNIGGIAPAPGRARDVTRRQQAELANRDPSVSYFDNADLRKHLYDGLHFDKAAKLIVGKRFADQYLADARPVRVACVGDSITFGASIKNRERNAYPARLQGLLGDDYQVRNFGISGSGVIKTARRARTRWQRAFMKQPQFRASIAFEPDIVVINLGINDLPYWNEKSKEFLPDYIDLIQRYQTLPSKPRVFVWCKLAPLFPGHAHANDPNISQLNGAIGQAAQRTGVSTIDLYGPLADKPAFFPDHIHPNADGAAVIAREVFDAIKGFGSVALVDKTIESDPVASFEKAEAGHFDRLETTIGTWTPIDGKTIIDDEHAKTGKHCLQLTGGPTTSVVLEVADGMKATGTLSFWAERWTKGAPFSFRIARNSNEGWKEVFNGDTEIRVGRAFLSQVEVPLGDDSIRQLRFSVTSPPNTGILIDDIRLTLAPLQTNVSVEAVESEADGKTRIEEAANRALKAANDIVADDLVEGYLRLRAVVRRYRQTEAGTHAQKLAEKMLQDPTRGRTIKRGIKERDATEMLDLCKSYIELKKYDTAYESLRDLVRKYPRTHAAVEAKRLRVEVQRLRKEKAK